MFLSYLPVQRPIAGQPTVYRVGDDACYLFDKHACGRGVDIGTLFGLGGDAIDEALTNLHVLRSQRADLLEDDPSKL